MDITRKQLKHLGVSDYLVKRLTQTLQPSGKQGRLYNYNIEQVLSSICNLIDTPKVRKATKVKLTNLKSKISSFIADTIPNKRLLEAMQRVSVTNAQFEHTAREAREIAARFQDYKRKRGLDFTSKNNIAIFTN